MDGHESVPCLKFLPSPAEVNSEGIHASPNMRSAFSFRSSLLIVLLLAIASAIAQSCAHR